MCSVSVLEGGERVASQICPVVSSYPADTAVTAVTTVTAVAIGLVATVLSIGPALSVASPALWGVVGRGWRGRGVGRWGWRIGRDGWCVSCNHRS